MSTTGNDANDGFTSGTAVLKFSTALTKAIAGEKIYVSGMVDFSTEANLPTGVVISKNITIQGTSNTTDGFDGKNLTRFLNIGNYNVTLKNLKLKDGYSGNNNGGAIIMNTSTGTLSCENVIFDANKTGMNAEFTAANRTGGAIHISNSYEASFKNCVFSNNESAKTGAVHITNWAASKTIKFEGCAFVGNIAKESFGGSAIFILTTNDNNTLSLINCTFAKNEVRTTANGGTIYVYKGSANTVTNIINCTVTENTNAGTDVAGAGVYMKNTTDQTDNYLGKLYIYNTVIEGNKAANNTYSDLSTSIAPSNTTLQINNCLIGRQGSTAVIPAGCFGATNQYNYLTSASTTNAYKGGLAPYNSTSNVYPLYSGSLAIDYGASTYLTSLSPTVTTDQLGNTRTVAATNYAGAWESTPIATTTPASPTSLVATAGDGQASVAFTTAATGGSNVTNYKYSLNDGAYVACSPAKTTSPIVITGLTNTTAYTIKLKAVNVNGDGAESAASNSVTPDATANDIPVSTAINVSTLALTPVSDLVVSSNVLTINQATTVNSITVAPGAKITVNGTNALTATNGITLQSGPSGTATLVNTDATGVSITATVQQYLPVVTARNWYTTSPVAGATVPSGQTYYSYDESGSNTGFVAPATLFWVALTEGAALNPAKGYIAKPSSTTTLSYTGVLNNGTKTVDLTRSAVDKAGFNLVANPYPSYLDWSMVDTTAAKIMSSVWYRTKTSGDAYTFDTYNGKLDVATTLGLNMVTKLIPPMQAFWVRVKAGETAGTLTFTNAMRKHVDNTSNKFKARASSEMPIIRLRVSNGTNSDEAIICFNPEANNSFDSYDSQKMFNNSASVPEIYTVIGNEKLVINGLSSVNEVNEIPLGFVSGTANDFTISAHEMKNFDVMKRVILWDKLANTETELSEGAVYHFASQSTTSTDRFSLLFRVPGVTTEMDNATKINTQVFINAANQITIIAPVKSNYAIFNAMGQQVTNGVTTSNYQTANTKLAAGMYIVKVGNNSTRVIAH